MMRELLKYSNQTVFRNECYTNLNKIKAIFKISNAFTGIWSEMKILDKHGGFVDLVRFLK
jgi:hypothetical protein